jgi:hypothetical protein
MLMLLNTPSSRVTVTDGEQGDIEPNVLQAIEEEDHTEEEQQVVVARHHVLGAHVDERHQQYASTFLDKALVTFSTPWASASGAMAHSTMTASRRKKRLAQTRKQRVCSAQRERVHRNTPGSKGLEPQCGRCQN